MRYGNWVLVVCLAAAGCANSGKDGRGDSGDAQPRVLGRKEIQPRLPAPSTGPTTQPTQPTRRSETEIDADGHRSRIRTPDESLGERG